MEINEAFKVIEKQLATTNEELSFSKSKSNENELYFVGDNGAYKIEYNKENKIMAFSCANQFNGEEPILNVVSKSLFDEETYNEKDAKSLANEVSDELESVFKSRKKVDLDKVKMPKAVSRTKAKNGVISYDTDSLANRFGVLYPDMKNLIKANIVKYGEFLPETFFQEYGNQKVLDVIKNGPETERKKLFKMLNEVYEDGTNEVQDIIGVTILGEMKNDSAMMAVADKYMIEYMAGPVHEINKLTAKKNKYTKKLANPPAYKPKKKKVNPMANALGQN